MYQVSRYQIDMSTGIHSADLLTGLIMFKGLHIHLSVWIYERVGRVHKTKYP